jgi:hypothetical protein
MTGGNTFIPKTLAALWPGEVNQAALDAGVTRARAMLQKAATLSTSSPSSGVLRVRVTNETAHKLPSGYPEGRRIWINIRFFDANAVLLGETGRYDSATATLVADPQLKVYESSPGSRPTSPPRWATRRPQFPFRAQQPDLQRQPGPPRGIITPTSPPSSRRR